MSDTTPKHARISSLAHWTTFFHHTDGLFRLPSPEGEAIHHLDIDLRYVGDKDIPQDARHLDSDRELFLPNVVKLTLRGGEYVQNDDVRMDCLAEVLLAIKPVEVRWLNATDDPTEQLTFATHLVHPAIIAAGEYWSRVGSLRKLVIQGGFPVPNLTAPTPFALTPAATPCPSPGPARISFGFSRPGSPSPHAHSSHSHPHTPFSGLPALSTTKPKPVDEERVKAREERRRLADYSLKPRFEYAFGGCKVEELHWRLDGRYTPACILSIITHFFKALDRSFPSSSRKADIPLPSLLAFTSLPASLLPQIASLAGDLELDEELREYLADVGFGATQQTTASPFARVFAGKVEEGVGREREVKRTKAEMLLLQANGATVVFTEDLSKVGGGSTAAAGTTGHAGDTLTLPPTATTAISPAGSIASLVHTDGDGDAVTEDESEAVTPEDGGSPVVQALEQAVQGGKGKEVGVEGERSLGSSMVL
ncbi:hypothetical protein IAT38_002927 [Cryptococcus sp. DSM 104549]